MQNPYAVERFIQEHNANARALAELQGLRRRAMAERRRVTWEMWRGRIAQLFSREAVPRRLAEQGRD